MTLPAWVTGAALFGVVAASWDRVKWVLSRITSMFIVNMQLERELARAIALYCWKNFRRSPFGARRYSSFHEYVRTIHRNQVVAFETIGQDPIVFCNHLPADLAGIRSGDEGHSIWRDLLFHISSAQRTVSYSHHYKKTKTKWSARFDPAFLAEHAAAAIYILVSFILPDDRVDAFRDAMDEMLPKNVKA